MTEIIVTIKCNLAVAIFVYGRLTEWVKAHGRSEGNPRERPPP